MCPPPFAKKFRSRSFRFQEFVWPEDRINHIARHSITPEEIEEVCFGRALIQRAKGRVRIYNSRIYQGAVGGGHLMGTTRMGASPSSSVVDANGRVHGYANLFVAGSSLFPTSGYANPTLTIVALALRLADRLKAA